MASIFDLLSGNNSSLNQVLNQPQQQEEVPDDEIVKQLQQNYARNQAYARQGQYQTKLDPQTEAAFLQWVKQNNIPFDPSLPVQDYDMRGYYKAMQAGDPRATQAVDPNDGLVHRPDYWKTPYHETFSNESQWATPDAPKWSGDKLVDKSGKVIFDDRAKNKKDQ